MRLARGSYAALSIDTQFCMAAMRCVQAMRFCMAAMRVWLLTTVLHTCHASGAWVAGPGAGAGAGPRLLYMKSRTIFVFGPRSQEPNWRTIPD